MESSRKPILVAIGGEAADIISGLDLGPDTERLVIDTDHRTATRYSDLSPLIIGKRVVNGEGSGGNMNLARACFKMDMEEIAPIVLGRPLVMMLSSTEGATGIAGAVEISSLLVKVGMPAFSFLLHDPGPKRGGMDPLHIASMLLDGPLRPGCILMKGSSNISNSKDPYGLTGTIPYFLEVVKGVQGFVLPPTCWAMLRDDGGPFEMGPIEIDDVLHGIEIKAPAVIALHVPEVWTTERVRSTLDPLFGQIEGMHLGISPVSGIDIIQGAYIAKASQNLPGLEGPPPDAEMLREMMGGPIDIDISPERNVR
jgi:hypothetical protein